MVYRMILRQTNDSASRVGDADSTPRRRRVAMNVSAVNQGLVACDAKEVVRPSTLRRQVPSSSGTYVLGLNGLPSYLGISYSRIRWLRNVFQVSSARRR